MMRTSYLPVIVFVGLLAGAFAGIAAPTALAQPSGFPADSEWIAIGTDPDEGGAANDFRDVSALFYQVQEGFLFLRMQNRADAGWPNPGASGRARYKWFFDTANADGVVQGGNVRNAEYMLMVEDLTLNASDPTLTRDQLGEQTFLDDLANVRFLTRWNSTNPPAYTTNTPNTAPSPSPDWRRLLGTGTAGAGGPQGVNGTEIGYRITGPFMDMYIDLALLGNPASPLRVLWLTDQQDTSLDQAPCCDRPEDGLFIPLELTGDVSIVKEASRESTQSFGFTGDLGAFSLVDDGTPSNTQAFLGLDPGTYDVTETVPAGWSLGSIVCDGDDDGGSVVNVAGATVSIDLDPGEQIACTFLDTEIPAMEGTVVIVKDAIPDGPQSFDFTGGLGAFSLSDSSPVDKSITFTGVTAGTYDVTETVPAGWDLTGIVCVDPDGGTTVDVGMATATLDVDDGEVVTCTFVDIQRGSITVEKTTQPPQMNGQLFDFGGALGAFSLGDGGSTTVMNLVPGTYDVTETVPMGWLLTGIVCDDTNSTFDLGTATASIVLDAGESVTCTFTNSLPGTLVIRKDAIPDDPQDFDFESGLQPFTLDDANPDDADAFTNSITFSDLAPGLIDVTEVVPAGWTLTNIVCNDPTANTSVDVPNATASVQLDPDETVTCTFVDTMDMPQQGSITIVKDAQPDDPQVFDFTGDLGAFALDDDGVGANSVTFAGLLPGAYSVSETVPVGWSLGSIVCDDPDNGSAVDVLAGTAAIDLDAGEAVSCVFVNTEIPAEGGTITIVKDAIPDGPQIFDFTGDLGPFDLVDGGPGSKSVSFPNLNPGIYDVTETVPAGWTLTTIHCIDADGGTTVNVGTATATIDLDAAEAVTCTFINEVQQPIFVIPTLSEWMLLLLAVLLAAVALLALRRAVMP